MMKVEYHRWYSPSLGQDMELKVYGHTGKPLMAFPCQGGRFYEWEDFGMIEAGREFIESGQVKLFTVDSVDGQSWANRGAHPADRALRHEHYDRYIVQEVAPFMREHCGKADQKFLTAGCSMGGYHASNFFFRHPDVFDGMISLSGLFQLKMFVGDYVDDHVYFNSPLYYLPNMNDAWYLDQYRQSKIIVCTGQGAWEEAMVADARALQLILGQKNVPAWIDLWGQDANHDWPWWRKQLPYYLGHLGSAVTERT
jgi:esterase/lipase superfamily enzyme